MIWLPLFEDCNGVAVRGKWLVQAGNREAALHAATSYFQTADHNFKPFLTPNRMAWRIVDMEEVIFYNGVALL